MIDHSYNELGHKENVQDNLKRTRIFLKLSLISLVAICVLDLVYSTGIKIYAPTSIPTKRDPECTYLNFFQYDILGHISFRKYQFNYPKHISGNVILLFVRTSFSSRKEEKSLY
jgi:hypothetical protein